jgi:hypothetical protein
MSRRLNAILRLWPAVFIVAAAGGVVSARDAHACAVCWGSGADDLLSRGINWGILFLMAMPFTIAGVIGGWLVYKHRHPETRKTPQPADAPYPLQTREERAR